MFKLTDQQKYALGEALLLCGDKPFIDSVINLRREQNDEEEFADDLEILVYGILLEAVIKHATGNLRSDPSIEIYKELTLDHQILELLLKLGEVAENVLLAKELDWGIEFFKKVLLELVLSAPGANMTVCESGNVVVMCIDQYPVSGIKPDENTKNLMLNSLLEKHGVQV